jgi:hypothetical protein
MAHHPHIDLPSAIAPLATPTLDRLPCTREAICASRAEGAAPDNGGADDLG